MCERCDELLEELRQMREAMAPPYIDAPFGVRLTGAQLRVWRALLSRREGVSHYHIAVVSSPYSIAAGGDPRTLSSVHILNIRRALEVARAPYVIESIRNYGYRVRALT